MDSEGHVEIFIYFPNSKYWDVHFVFMG